jgi:hypothetical protein
MWSLLSSSLYLLQQDDSSAIGFAACGCIVYLILILVLVIPPIIGMWKTFVKANQPGWAAIVPIYNIYVICELVGRPWWWLLLCFIPCVGWVVGIMLCIDLAKSFGKGTGFGVGLALLPQVFMCILGFGSAKYLGPSVPPQQPVVPTPPQQ